MKRNEHLYCGRTACQMQVLIVNIITLVSYSISSFFSTCQNSFLVVLKILWCSGVWNPWDRKAKALADLGDEDYKMMLCVDSSAIENSIILKPSEEWTGCQELSTVSSSYCSGQLDPRKVLQGFHWLHPCCQQRFLICCLMCCTIKKHLPVCVLYWLRY